ncbi:Sulfate adenylyltransferase subunit 2 [Melia azedarach]|uniref:Sulfate adenylyltransferase subunit 2 n=1 Tax=Melia azedarach TaxID=155640 RepID=A0ACC1WY46_MELAZ|nr:Sulfate adenylyltransferase subunit 2 [Melia azedarach]
MYYSQVVSLNPLNSSYSTRPESHRFQLSNATRYQNGSQTQSWTSLLLHLKCNGKFSCLFSNNRREEQARKALESALGGKKNEFEKWNKEIKRREEVGGGGDAGGGGWFGWGGRFGWSNGDNFWQEAQQTSLAVLGIIVMYLIVAKGELMLAVIFNPVLYALRGTRNGFTFITSRFFEKASPNGLKVTRSI